MDRNGIGFVILAVALVLGVFWFAGFAGVDQTRLAAARVDVATRLERQPEAVEAAVNVGMTLAAKVIAGALVSLLVAGLVIAWQAARIRGLREGGWERFWARRHVRGPREAKQKTPSLSEMMALMLMEQMQGRRRIIRRWEDE